MLQERINFKTYRKGSWQLIPAVSGVVLLLLLFLALTPLPVSSAHAEGDNGATTFSAWLSPSVTLTMTDSVSEDIEPTVSGTFKNLATVAHVEVNNSDYYEVSLHASSKDMVNSSAGSNAQAKISSITTAQNQASFTPNQWGYNLTKNPTGVTTATPTTTDTEYQPIATTATAMPGIGKQATTNNAASDYYTLNFGAKVDTSIPAGLYSSTVTLSVVASPKQVTGFDRTDTMQGMTADICKEIGSDADLANGGATKYAATDSLGNTYYTKRLKDLRDGKLYWVAKLKDGNCWMTQNLALDITEAGLTPELSDVAEPWNSQSEYPPVGTDSTIENVPTEQTSVSSWTQGLYVFANPIEVNACALWAASLSECVEQFVSVDDKTPSSNPNFTIENGNSYNNSEYDAHYLVGNWYAWNAATAGTGGHVNSGDAPGSICPKGWKMPITTYPTGGTSGSFQDLMSRYERSAENYASTPLFFVRSGNIALATSAELASATIAQPGKYGVYWSRTAYEGHPERAWEMYIQAGNDINMWYTAEKYNGLSVRCLVNTKE